MEALPSTLRSALLYTLVGVAVGCTSPGSGENGGDRKNGEAGAYSSSDAQSGNGEGGTSSSSDAQSGNGEGGASSSSAGPSVEAGAGGAAEWDRASCEKTYSDCFGSEWKDNEIAVTAPGVVVSLYIADCNCDEDCVEDAVTTADSSYATLLCTAAFMACTPEFIPGTLWACISDVPPAPVCGNGTVENGESCDDGTNSGAYGGCKPDCTPAPRCGDGVVDDGEECDDEFNTGNYGGCRPDCTLAPYCGDGTVQSESGELCDNGEQNVKDGYGAGVCTTICRPAPRCGDGVVSSSESCDDGNTESDDGCSATCATEDGWICRTPGHPCERNEFCGDGILNSEEECDDGNDLPGDCCDELCLLEPNCSCATPSPPLDPPHQVCSVVGR
jgi:cysteine-rich repeat protein